MDAFPFLSFWPRRPRVDAAIKTWREQVFDVLLADLTRFRRSYRKLVLVIDGREMRADTPRAIEYLANAALDLYEEEVIAAYKSGRWRAHETAKGTP